MRHGWKIYAAHHRIEMPMEIASLKCQASSINQSSRRNNNASPMARLSRRLLMGIGNDT
uniref:Uncharacterized protein n=1 Tax=Paramormyrops kingsleyae TaxID=1676925 RepID=A0A3B3RYK0_9TELE